MINSLNERGSTFGSAGRDVILMRNITMVDFISKRGSTFGSAASAYKTLSARGSGALPRVKGAGEASFSFNA